MGGVLLPRAGLLYRRRWAEHPRRGHPDDLVVHGCADRSPGERDHRLLGDPDPDPGADPDPGPDRDSDADPGSYSPADRAADDAADRAADDAADRAADDAADRAADDATDRAADDATDRAADDATDRAADDATTDRPPAHGRADTDRVGRTDRDDPADAAPTGPPEPTPPPDVPPPIIVGKLTDSGTPGDPTDDTLLPGSTFAFYRDDGDAVFEPDGDDAPRLAEVDSDTGFHVWTPPGPGRYWVHETDSAEGYDLAPPRLVDYLLTRSTDNCVVQPTELLCSPDDDGVSAGLRVVAVTDSLTGGVAGLTPPPTDVDQATGEDRGDNVPVMALLTAWALLAGAIGIGDRRRRRVH